MTTDEILRQGLARSLFQMTWPMLFGVLSLLGFQLVDAAFIGQLGVRPLAALGFTVPVMQLVIGTQVGIGIATTALVSRAVGAGQTERSRRLGGLVVVCGAVVITVLCLLIWVVRRPLLTALGASPSLLPLVYGYWIPWLLSAWTGAALYFGYSVCRAHGNTRLPGLMMVVTSLINLVLDPLYIFVFGWGLPGAALATLTAFGVGATVIYPRLLSRRWLRFDLHALPPLPALKQLGAISGPAMVSQLMPPLSAMLATALVARFGSAAVAAWGLGTRLEFFSIVAVLALTMSMPPMVGRFLGAGDLDTVRALVRIAVRFVLAWQLVIAVVWFVSSGVIAGLLTGDAGVASTLGVYLRRVPLSYGGLGVCMLMVSVSNALGLPLRAMTISGCRLFVCYLPALWIGAQVADLPGLFVGALTGNLAAGCLAYSVYRQAMKRRLPLHAQVGSG